MNAYSKAEVTSDEGPRPETRDRSIGDLIRDARSLSAAEVERVLGYQREKGIRFGEAAVALGLASEDDVLNALGQQFHYPIASAERKVASPELVALNQPFSPQAEAIRALRSQVTMRVGASTAQKRALAVVSAQSGDGRSYITANLAAALAQLGGKVLLVDADLRSPRQHLIFNVANATGLSTVLSGRTDSLAIQPVDGVPSLMVMPAGALPPNPLELIERPAFGLLMRDLAQKFDHVIVDTPAAERGADAAVIAAKCGSALLLARKHASRVAALRELVASFEGAGTQLLGAVFNEHQ